MPIVTNSQNRDSAPTPAERGLTKTCNRCGERKPIESYYVRDFTRITTDGRRWRMSICDECHLKRSHDKRKQNPGIGRAYQRAKTRVADACPELFNLFFNEELVKEQIDPATVRRRKHGKTQPVD